jgi:hypothetical protein
MKRFQPFWKTDWLPYPPQPVWGVGHGGLRYPILIKPKEFAVLSDRQESRLHESARLNGNQRTQHPTRDAVTVRVDKEAFGGFADVITNDKGLGPTILHPTAENVVEKTACDLDCCSLVIILQSLPEIHPS